VRHLDHHRTGIRRVFTPEYKLAILAEHDRCTEPPTLLEAPSPVRAVSLSGNHTMVLVG
jgi:hypothetical protein